MSCNPAGVTTHDFHHHDTVVAFSRGVQTIDGVGGNLHGGIETKAHIGSFNVVVNCLWDNNNREPNFIVQLRGNIPASVATDNSMVRFSNTPSHASRKPTTVSP
jgi:hypothetical protein